MNESHDSEERLIDNHFILPPQLSYTCLVFEAHLHVAKNEPILILGDTGVGKSLFLKLARFDFEEECKKNEIKPLIVEANCAHFAGGSSDLNITRSELFGHKKGAFSGAIKDKKGIVEKANNGLLILEEIGELPLEVQAMLLTFIETGEYHRVGDNITKKATVRLVGATNRVSSLRDDFRYRFFPFYVPSLSERRGDILYYFYEKYPDLTQKLLTRDVLVLLSYNWPGNVREIERVAKLLTRKKRLDDMINKDGPLSSDYLYSYSLYNLKGEDTALDSSLLRSLTSSLIDRGVDLNLIESLLNKKRIGIVDRDEEFAFPELSGKKNIWGLHDDGEHSSIVGDDGEHSIIVRWEYKPFKEAYEGYEAFCGLFLQDPSKDKNILADLSDCSYSHLNLNLLDFPKSKEKQVYKSAKEIMKLLKKIEIKEYKWPKDIREFWLALEDISQENYNKRSLSEQKTSDERIENIYSMNETDLRKLYYSGLLKRTGGSVTLAAEMAGLKTTTFAARLKKLDIKYSRKKN